jgi:hypothetical protein
MVNINMKRLITSGISSGISSGTKPSKVQRILIATKSWPLIRRIQELTHQPKSMKELIAVFSDVHPQTLRYLVGRLVKLNKLGMDGYPSIKGEHAAKYCAITSTAMVDQ